MGDPVRGRVEPADQRGRRTLSRAFADTSILLGFLDGHAGCVAARKGVDWVTTHAHLLELYSVLLGRPEIPTDQPGAILESLLPLTVPIPHGAVQPAAEIRRKLRAQKKDCSYIDSLGYGVATSLGIPFLIADEAFDAVHGATRVPIEGRSTPQKKRGTLGRRQSASGQKEQTKP